MIPLRTRCVRDLLEYVKGFFMRVLFSAVPVAGHVLPLLPMAGAAQTEGHEVAILTSEGLRELVAPVQLLGAGPSIEDQVAETVRRTGRRWAGPGPEAAEMFAGTRVDVTYDQALMRPRPSPRI